MPRRTRTPSYDTVTLSADELSAPGFADVALKITGGDPPSWLVDFLRDWASSLVLDRGVLFIQPTRAEMRKNLAAILNNNAESGNPLQHVATENFIYAPPPQTTVDDAKKRHASEDFTGLVSERLAGLVTENGKTKAGRSKAAPPHYYLPKTFCAAVIAEAWKAVRGVDPGPKNPHAAAAAELLWRAAIQDLSMEVTEGFLNLIVASEPKSWGNPITGWRYHFLRARKPAVVPIRKEIRRHLSEAKRQAAILSEDATG